MIGRLTGIIVEKKPPALLIDVNGVGYEVDAPMSTFYLLPELGKKIVLYTHLVVREDAQLLYGFASEQERKMFRQLIKVSGVGAKMAISILSGMSADEFARCIRLRDTSSLTRVPGIGKKTAERLVVEMHDRLKGDESPLAVSMPVAGGVADGRADAISALIALGYKPAEASRWVESISGDDLPSEELIRQALRLAAK
jgi:Holliday junction DNA helicase RuvA